MTAPRALPRRLAGLVEQMELDQPRVVTLSDLTRMAGETGARIEESDVVALAYRLRDLGWFGTVRTQGVWEFNPGSRAGAYGSGDRFIELRGYLAVHPEWRGALAMESAATILGLAQHLPRQEVISIIPGQRCPRALSDWRMVSVDIPDVGRTHQDGLPLWNIAGLVAGIALRPSAYHDLAGLAQWLPEVRHRLHEAELMDCLANAPDSAWQRAAYLTRIAGADAVSCALLEQKPPQHPVWFGATRRGGVYDRVTKVNDADLIRFLEGGTGA